jgi:hypothetical protein
MAALRASIALVLHDEALSDGNIFPYPLPGIAHEVGAFTAACVGVAIPRAVIPMVIATMLCLIVFFGLLVLDIDVVGRSGVRFDI